MTETNHDIAIVGAGPAGSSAAIRLAIAGLDVALIEKKTFPREKLCGEFISPECLAHFEDLGVMPNITRAGGTDLSETVFYARNGKSVAVKSEWFGSAKRHAIGLSRAEMDLLLLRQAAASGVTVLEASSAAGLLMDGDTVCGLKIKDPRGFESRINARITIDATGRTRALSRRLEPSSSGKAAEYVAFKTHLRGARLAPGACEIYVYNGGYGGCNLVEDDLYNLCFIASASDTKRLGSDAERVLREVVFTNRRAADAMKDATIAKPWHAVPIQRFGRGEIVPAAGLIAIGDAAAFIDPFTGSGILLALESGKIAATAIARAVKSGAGFDSLAAEYRRGYSLAFDKRLRICSMLRHVAFVPFFAEAAIKTLSFSKSLRKRIARATR